jgi:hypothetical protein
MPSARARTGWCWPTGFRGRVAGAAATVLGKAVKADPNDADLWVALGNTLVGHSDGLITPAAQFAFQKAAKISPEHPGPPFFMGLALAQSGKLVEARAIWAELLRRAPADAPIGKTSRPGWRDSIDAGGLGTGAGAGVSIGRAPAAAAEPGRLLKRPEISYLRCCGMISWYPVCEGSHCRGQGPVLSAAPFRCPMADRRFGPRPGGTVAMRIPCLRTVRTKAQFLYPLSDRPPDPPSRQPAQDGAGRDRRGVRRYRHQPALRDARYLCRPSPLPLDQLHVYGIISLMFWSMMIIVTLKYVSVIMRADNKGEGGSLALLALINQHTSGNRWGGHRPAGVFATALFYGDSMITPPFR